MPAGGSGLHLTASLTGQRAPDQHQLGTGNSLEIHIVRCCRRPTESNSGWALAIFLISAPGDSDAGWSLRVTASHRQLRLFPEPLAILKLTWTQRACVYV